MAAISLWEFWVNQLRHSHSRFRMVKRPGKTFIFIREMKGGKVLREFSSKAFRPQLDEHIEACGKLCLEASRAGVWPEQQEPIAAGKIAWADLAALTLVNLRERVARVGSRRNAEGHLKELAGKKGVATVESLKDWALERSPISQPSAFRNRLETLSHIDKAVEMDLKPLITELKAMKPTGAAKKENESRTQKIKAIPTDEALEAWLDGLDGFEQWTLALIATYGLRPSEAWHAEQIDDQGWITIPGEGLTKTARHYAPPQPAKWLERYELRENFERYQAQLNEAYPIQWEDRKGLRIPVNNSVATNALYLRIAKDRLAPRLWVGDEWVRPYDLRHSYAIRCETSTDPELLSTPREDFARWLGHGQDVHERVYLKFIPRSREIQSMQARYGAKENPAGEAGLSEEILAKLKKLEQLEKLLAS